MYITSCYVPVSCNPISVCISFISDQYMSNSRQPRSPRPPWDRPPPGYGHRTSQGFNNATSPGALPTEPPQWLSQVGAIPPMWLEAIAPSMMERAAANIQLPLSPTGAQPAPPRGSRHRGRFPQRVGSPGGIAQPPLLTPISQNSMNIVEMLQSSPGGLTLPPGFQFDPQQFLAGHPQLQVSNIAHCGAEIVHVST